MPRAVNQRKCLSVIRRRCNVLSASQRTETDIDRVHAPAISPVDNSLIALVYVQPYGLAFPANTKVHMTCIGHRF